MRCFDLVEPLQVFVRQDQSALEVERELGCDVDLDLDPVVNLEANVRHQLVGRFVGELFLPLDVAEEACMAPSRLGQFTDDAELVVLVEEDCLFEARVVAESDHRVDVDLMKIDRNAVGVKVKQQAVEYSWALLFQQEAVEKALAIFSCFSSIK